MKKDNYLRLILILTLPFGLFNVSRAEAISLDRAVAYALENSPVLQGTVADIRAGNETVKTAESGKLPVIDLDYGLIYSDNPLVSLGSILNNRKVVANNFVPAALNDPGFSGNYFASLSLKLPLYTGGRLSADIKQARAKHALALAQHERSKSTVIYQVKRAYLLAQAAQQAIRIARSSTDTAGMHVKTTEQLLAENRTVTSDKLTATVYYTSIKAVISQAQAQYAHALNSLKQVIGKDLSTDISIEPWKRVISPHKLPAITVAESTALKNRSDLRSAEESIKAARARTDIAQSATKPQLGLELRSRLYADNPMVDELSWGVLAVAKINLFSGGANKSRVSAAREETNRLQAEKRNKELQIRKQVRDAFASIEEGRIRLKLASTNLTNARTAVSLVNQRYGEGRTILIDLLQSEQALLKSRSESLNSRLLVEASILELEFAMDDYEVLEK